MGKKRKSASKAEEASSSKPKLLKLQPPPPPPAEESEEEEEHVESEPEEVEAEEEESSSSSSSSESEEEEEEVEEAAVAEAEEESDDKSSSSSSSSEEEEEEEEDDDTKRDSIKKLLEPFGKDQLISILKEAASKTPSIIEHITKTVDSDPIQRKIFVHGLAWDTNSETLAAAFKPFGAIEECKVVCDKITNRSKGYGFILFKTSASARKALKQPQKKIGSRMAACQLASSGANQSNQQHQQPQSQPAPVSGRRLYVANVGPHIAPEKLRAFFAEFGELEDGPVALGGLDKDTGKFKGFAILVYKSAEGVKKALEESVKFFQGNKLQCSVATEGRSVNKNNNSSSNSNDAKPNNVVATSVPGVAPTLPVAAFNPALAGQAFNPGQTFNPSQAFNPGAVFMAPNPALGVLNLNHVGFGFPGGMSQPLNRVGNAPNPMGLTQLSAGGFGAQPPINSISPSVIGSYGAQAALQGLGAYQSSQMAQSSAVPRPQTGTGPVGTMPSYLGR